MRDNLGLGAEVAWMEIGLGQACTQPDSSHEAGGAVVNSKIVPRNDRKYSSVLKLLHLQGEDGQERITATKRC